MDEQGRQKVNGGVENGHSHEQVLKEGSPHERGKGLRVANRRGINQTLLLGELGKALHPLDDEHRLAQSTMLEVASTIAGRHHARVSLTEEFDALVRHAKPIVLGRRRSCSSHRLRDGRQRRCSGLRSTLSLGHFAPSMMAAELLALKADMAFAWFTGGFGNRLAQCQDHFVSVLATAMRGTKFLASKRHELFATQLGGFGNGSATGQSAVHVIIIDGLWPTLIGGIHLRHGLMSVLVAKAVLTQSLGASARLTSRCDSAAMALFQVQSVHLREKRSRFEFPK